MASSGSSSAEHLLGKAGEVDREVKRKDKSIYIASWVGVIFSVAALAVTGAVLFTSTTLSSDKKVFFASVLLLFGSALQLAICVSRHRTEVLLLLTVLSTFVCALTLGLSITYAS